MQSPTEIPGLTQEEQKSSMRHSESLTVGAGSDGSTTTVLGQGVDARRLGQETMIVLGQEAVPRWLGHWEWWLGGRSRRLLCWERVGSSQMDQTCFGGWFSGDCCNIFIFFRLILFSGSLKMHLNGDFQGTTVYSLSIWSPADALGGVAEHIDLHSEMVVAFKRTHTCIGRISFLEIGLRRWKPRIIPKKLENLRIHLPPWSNHLPHYHALP
jgi:hypothetical protein